MSEKIEILVTGVAQQQVFPTQSGKDQLLMQLNRVDSFVGADAKLNINPLYKKKSRETATFPSSACCLLSLLLEHI